MIETKRILLLGIAFCCLPSANAHDPAANEYRGSSLRLGAFAIGNIDAQLYFGPEDLPIAVPIDVRKDLGFGDKLLAFRAKYDYRFSKRHAIAIGFYRFQLDGTRRLTRDIDIGGSEFEIGLDVDSRYEEEILKLAYNFIFHDEGRVALSVSPGIHLTSADFAISTRLDLGDPGGIGIAPPPIGENASVTAPLPILGGRMQYRMTPKWSVILASDVFFLTTGGQRGSLTDSSIVVEYQTDSAFGFGMGLNRFSLDLDLVDDGIRWDWQSVYSGAYLYVSAKF